MTRSGYPSLISVIGHISRRVAAGLFSVFFFFAVDTRCDSLHRVGHQSHVVETHPWELKFIQVHARRVPDGQMDVTRRFADDSPAVKDRVLVQA